MVRAAVCLLLLSGCLPEEAVFTWDAPRTMRGGGALSTDPNHLRGAWRGPMGAVAGQGQITVRCVY